MAVKEARKFGLPAHKVHKVVRTYSIGIRGLILKYGKERLRALIDLSPLRTLAGIVFTTSSDGKLPVLCELDESRYHLKENYKIGWKPIKEYVGFAQESYYIADFDMLVADGTIKVYVQA